MGDSKILIQEEKTRLRDKIINLRATFQLAGARIKEMVEASSRGYETLKATEEILQSCISKFTNDAVIDSDCKDLFDNIQNKLNDIKEEVDTPGTIFGKIADVFSNLGNLIPKSDKIEEIEAFANSPVVKFAKNVEEGLKNLTKELGVNSFANSRVAGDKIELEKINYLAKLFADISEKIKNTNVDNAESIRKICSDCIQKNIDEDHRMYFNIIQETLSNMEKKNADIEHMLQTLGSDFDNFAMTIPNDPKSLEIFSKGPVVKFAEDVKQKLEELERSTQPPVQPPFALDLIGALSLIAGIALLAAGAVLFPEGIGLGFMAVGADLVAFGVGCIRAGSNTKNDENGGGFAQEKVEVL